MASVKVKILAHVGPHKPGDVVGVSKEHAEFMCTPRKRSLGGGDFEDYRTAITVEEFEKLKNADLDHGGLTQGELEAMGEKFTVQTPHDPVFEAQLEAKRLGLEKDAKKKAAKAKAEKDAEDEIDEELDDETAEPSEKSGKKKKSA
jgi:hypothetical protein